MNTETTEQTEIVVNTITPEIVILDPAMGPMERIGTMARLCYRSEPKEGEDVAAVNERIVKKCIKDGHESVLEHGAYSVFLPIDEVEDSWKISEKLSGAKSHRINFRQVWEQHPSDSQNKYLSAFNDPEIAGRHYAAIGIEGGEKAEMPLPVIVGDVRAWRIVLREKMFVAANMYADPLELSVIFKVAYDLHKVAPILFEDIVTEINTFLSMEIPENSRYRIDRMLRGKLTAEEKNIDGFVKHFFDRPDDLFADQASSGATLSVIFTTDRATTHQLVRHRKCVGYSQEAQRYVNYDKKGYGHMAFTIDPTKAGTIKVDPITGVVDVNEAAAKEYELAMQDAFRHYHNLINLGVPSEASRKVLPNDATTKIGVTWLLPSGFSNFLFWRVDKHAQFDIRRMTVDMFVKGLEMDHPFFRMLNPEVIKKFLETIKEQKMFATDETIDNLVKAQDDHLKLIAEFQAAQMKAYEEAQKKAEEEARKAAEEHAANPDAAPAGGQKVIKVHGSDTNAKPTEEVVERPTRIDALTPEMLKKTESAE